MLSFQQMQEMQHSARDTELERVASWNNKVFILQPAHFHSTFALVCHLITEKAITSSYVRHTTKQNYLILFHRASCFPELWHRSQALKQFQIPMRESWCHIEVYVFSQEFLCWNTTRFHPQFNLHSRIRPDFRRKKGFRWNILETVTGQMLGDFCHGWRPCAEIVLLDAFRPQTVHWFEIRVTVCVLCRKAIPCDNFPDRNRWLSSFLYLYKHTDFLICTK